MDAPAERVYVVMQPTTPAKVPIDPHTNDPFYRYQMRQLQIQHIGNGKMMRTQLLNPSQIAQDLKVPESYLPTFVAHSLGAKATFDAKKPERERASVSGHVPVDEFSTILRSFIQKFVMCEKCKLPEWSYVPLSKRVGLKCRSCGNKTYVDALDLLPKFIKFVQNKPPPKTKHLDKSANKGQAAVKKRQKEDAKLIKLASKLDVDRDESEIEFETDLSEAARAQRAAEMVPDKMKAIVDLAGVAATTDDDSKANEADDKSGDDVGGDTKVNEENEAAAAADDDDDDDDDDEGDAVETMRAALDDTTEALRLLSVVDDDDDEAALLLDAAVADVADFGAVIKQRCALFVKFVRGSPARAAALLSNWNARIAALDADARTALKKTVPVHCKQLYDADVIEEDSFLKWQRAHADAPLSALAAPFLTWLQEADEESS